MTMCADQPGRRRFLIAGLAAGCLCAMLAGCESQSKPVVLNSEYGGGELAASGVRVVVCQVDDLPSGSAQADGPAPALANLLAMYAKEPSPIDAATARAWRGCGLRIVPVPAADVDRLQRSLNVVGAMENRWLGEVTQWMEVAHSPEISLPLTMRLDNGPITVSEGTLRLLLRAWIAPVPGEDGRSTRGVLQLEMVPDLKPPRTRNALIFDTLEHADPAPVPFWRLQLRAMLDGGQAILIVPEDPEVSWSSNASSNASSKDAGVEPKPASAMGPSAPPAPTLGELLLDREQTGGRRTRTVMMISAQVPPEYRLLP